MITNFISRPHCASLSILTLAIATLLSACSEPKAVDSISTTPNKYQLKDIQYIFSQGDRVDTTTLQLKESIVLNPSNSPASQQVEEGFGELMKTSRFSLDPASQLPKDLDLSKLEVNVPQQWYGKGLFDRSVETYSLSAVEQQKPYGFDAQRMITVKIPPKSKLTISRQITAYRLSCSFKGILENTTTGQQYRLFGRWAGLLQYENPSTTLKQSSL